MRDKLAAKHSTENLHGKKEAGVLRSNPVSVIRGQPAGRDDTVHMGMAGLAPGAEDAQYADLRAKMSGVSAMAPGALPEVLNFGLEVSAMNLKPSETAGWPGTVMFDAGEN